MSRSRISAEAIVLASHEARSDRVITLLTEEGGRFPSYAKGAMASTRRFGAHVEPLTRAHVELSVGGSGMPRLLSASTIESHAVLKADLLRFSLASTMCEIVLHLVPEHGREDGVYGLLKRALGHLNRPEVEAGEDHLLLFELKMLGLGGMLPELGQLDVDDSVQEVLESWLSGTWRPLERSGRQRLAHQLESRIQDASGRALKSRAFLDQMLDER